MSDWVRVATVEEFKEEDTALRVEVGATGVCLVRSRGRFYAVNDLCTHADVSLSEGEVVDGTIECWLHGSCFDLETGEPTGLPANRPVAVYPVKTEGDDIFVAVKE